MAIGAQLEAAREAAGLSLADVSATTNIRVDVLQGIEAEDFARCRGTSYARGHIRAYARAVGVEPDPLLAEFQARHPVAPTGRPVLPVPEREPGREPGRSYGRVVALTTALVALVVLLAWVVGGGDPAPASPFPFGTPAGTSAPVVDAPVPGG